MRFLLTNDDGFDAPGLAALSDAAQHFGECFVVAPSSAMSGCGHRVTTDAPLLVRSWKSNSWHVDGTPADCVRIAFKALELSVDFVLSGVNAGGNLGSDVYISGTVAAAREAAFHGVPGIALSHYRKRSLPLDWDLASEYARYALERALQREWKFGEYVNINFPHLPDGSPTPKLITCERDNLPLPVKYRCVEAAEGPAYLYEGEYANRERTPERDVAVCFSGNIAFSVLNTD